MSRTSKTSLSKPPQKPVQKQEPAVVRETPGVQLPGRERQRGEVTSGSDLPVGSDFLLYVNSVIERFYQQIRSFTAGRVRFCIKEWRKLTSDPNILEIIRGHKIQFSLPPIQQFEPQPIKFSEQKTLALENEISKLVQKSVVVPCEREENDFISNIFIRQKSDGTFRMMLNLSRLNDNIDAHHFKMESLKSVTEMITPGCSMASIDIKDAYYTVSVHEEFQKFLKFKWKGNFYKYTCWPNGLCICPQLFTKLIKAPVSRLREQGFLSVTYIDDFYLQGEDLATCRENVRATIERLNSLGFIIHPDKSDFHPTHELKFLGFIVNTLNMSVRLPADKGAKIISMCEALLVQERPEVR